MVKSLVGFGMEDFYTGETQQQVLTTDPSFRQRGHPTSTTLHLSKDSGLRNGILRQERLADWTSVVQRVMYNFEVAFELD
jgi:hypothetical protein